MDWDDSPEQAPYGSAPLRIFSPYRNLNAALLHTSLVK